ncbi:MAG: outer membrane beta-barrel family protein, partial [Flavobacteriales bacterium]
QNTAFVRDSSNAIIQRVVADNFQDDSFKNQTFSAYYTQQLDSLGQNFSIDADLVTYDSGSKQLFKNFIYNNNNVLTYSDQINGDLPSEINIYAAKADYYKPLPKGKFEAGAKVAFTETDNEAIYTSTVEGVTSPNYGLSNQFLYEEWINAAYVNFATSLGKVDLQAGLRGEATSLKGNQLGNVEQTDSSFTRSYESLFPTFYASWRMDSLSNNVLSLSYSRRINRPYFMDLNPFISPLDRFTFYTGNPNLLPTFSNNISITHTWKNIINATFSYSKTTDGINETLEIQDEIYYSRPGNIADSESYNFSLDGSIPVTKWYTVNFYASYGYQTFTGPLYDQNLASSGDYHFLN